MCVTVRLIKISTSGLRRREIRRRTAMTPYCPTDEIFISSVTIYEAAPILILLLFGMVISLIVFAIEHLVFYATNLKGAVNIKPQKKNKILLQHKVAPKGESGIFILPRASTLFHKVLMRK